MRNDLEIPVSFLRQRFSATVVSRVSRGRRLGCLMAIVLVSPTADAVESIDRLGRWMGFGWSDGYHACRDSGYHLGENLPPQSYASQVHAQSRACAHGRCNTTYRVTLPQGSHVATGPQDLPAEWQSVHPLPADIPHPVNLNVGEPQSVPSPKDPARHEVPSVKLRKEATTPPQKSERPAASDQLLENSDKSDLLDSDTLIPEKIPTPAPDLEPLSPSDSTRAGQNAPSSNATGTPRVKPATFLTDPGSATKPPVRLPSTK